MRFHPAWRIHAGRVDFKPTLSAFVATSAHKSSTAHIGDFCDRLTCSQAMGDFDNCAFGIAIQQQITFRIDDDAAAHLVAPVVIVGNAAQTAFDAAQDDWHILVCLSAALRINNSRPVRPLAADVARRVGIVTADFVVSGVAVDHRIHVARGHTVKQVRLAQCAEGIGALPIRLVDDADAKPLRFQHPANDCHAKAGMVNIGIAGDDDDVAAVPAQRGHL